MALSKVPKEPRAMRGMTEDSELSEVLKVSREMRERNNAAESRKGPGLCYSKAKREGRPTGAAGEAVNCPAQNVKLF